MSCVVPSSLLITTTSVHLYLSGTEADELKGDPVGVGEGREHIPPPGHHLEQIRTRN